jgi:restriction system protein
MTIWVHGEGREIPSIGEIVGLHCRFCHSTLVQNEIDDRWVGISRETTKLHKETVLGMAEIHGDFILREMELLGDPSERPAYLCTCPMCGWWHVSKEIYLCTRNQIWFVEFGTCATLYKFDTVDIRIPADEVRQYLAVKYESRFNVNPRRFEEVVSSVFASHGFRSHLTSYSADGGVDVILRDAVGRSIAVQVKRYKDVIEVASIRELLGAMVLNGFTKGAFVTTSTFQAGGREVVNAASARGLTLDLIDGQRFLSSLRIAQVKDFMRYPRLLHDDVLSSLQLQFGNEYHCKAL